MTLSLDSFEQEFIFAPFLSFSLKRDRQHILFGQTGDECNEPKNIFAAITVAKFILAGSVISSPYQV
jgi:hypothetical protein